MVKYDLLEIQQVIIKSGDNQLMKTANSLYCKKYNQLNFSIIR